MHDALEALKPFVWLALFAFLVGFVSYVALGRPQSVPVHEDGWAASVSAPVSDDWNTPKRI